MLIAAHIFAGALLGLVFWHLAGDRRAVPLCMAGAILPDLIDKPLGLVLPSILPGGRTLFHALIIPGIMLVCTVLLVRSRSRWLGAGVACAVLLHQVIDEMWTLPANWFWPLLGPFQGHMIPDYIGTYFRVELSDPSEWLFLIGSVLILAQSYSLSAGDIPRPPVCPGENRCICPPGYSIPGYRSIPRHRRNDRCCPCIHCPALFRGTNGDGRPAFSRRDGWCGPGSVGAVQTAGRARITRVRECPVGFNCSIQKQH